MPLEISPDTFNEDEILEELEGKPKIHVSRKSIVKAIKASTTTISILLQDAVEKDAQINMLTESNRALLNITRQLQKQLREMQETVKEQGIMLKEHDELIGSGRIEELFTKVEDMEARQGNLEENFRRVTLELRNANMEIKNELQQSTDMLKKNINDHKEFTAELGERTDDLTSRLADLGCETKEGQFRVRADKVAYGENMVALPRVMQSIQSDFADATELLESQLGEHQNRLDDHEPKVRLVPKCLEVATGNKNMLRALGVGEGKEENLLEQLQSIKANCANNTASLLEKADAAKITEVIEMKYDEIVEHLQLAISAATDDEDEFKRVAEELRGMVKDLMLNKSDKIDVLRLKEMIVADNTMREDMAHMKIAFGDKMSRKDCEEMMTSGTDKQEIMNNLTTMVRRLEKRMASKLAQLPTFNADGEAAFAGSGFAGAGTHSGEVRGRAMAVPGSDGSPRRGAKNSGPRPETKGPRLGPGGPSLGGGFQVCLPKGGEKLPRIHDERKNTPSGWDK